MKFANFRNSWLNKFVKNSSLNIRNKITSSSFQENTNSKMDKSTNINVLLNRVKTNQKNETRKKLYFSAAASTGLVLFGLIIF